MDTTYFALFWSLLFADAALGGYYEGFLNTKLTSWQNARTSCGKRKPACDLSVQRLDEAPFWESQALTLGTEYWVGARALGVLQWQKSKTSLIQAQGCYEATPKGLQGNNKAMGPERCQVKCDGNIIALQDRNCYCLSQAQLSTFTRRPDEECALFCDRESDRCGGTNDTIVSVYKIPDNTVFEKSGQKGLRDWFMMRTSNNQQELLQITNKPHKTFPNKARFCVTLKGVYSVVDIAAQCPKGSRPVGFDSIDVMEFLRATETVQEMTNTRYQLLLSYGKPDQWLDGGEVQGAEEKGDCTSISFDGQGYKLTNRQCKDKLQSVCSCYVKTETTTTTAAPTTTTTTTPAITTTTTTAATTTTTVTTTTTEELSTSTPTSPTTSTTDSTTMETTESTTLATTTPEPATTTTAPPSTTTVTTPPSLSTTESSSTSSTTESTTTESTTETTPPTATPASSSSSSSRSRSTTTTSASNTTTSASRTSSARKLAAASTTTMKNASASASTESPTTTTAAPSTKMSSLTTAATLFSTSSTTESIDMWKTQEGSTLLFPFKAMDDGKGHEHLPNDPAPNPGQSQSGTDGTKNSASASFSVEAIVGITVAAIVVAVILIVAVIVVQRRKNSSGRTLLKDNNTDKTEKKRSSKRETNYPI